MFYVLTCSFPASPSATHDTVINAAWVWLQSSARYQFTTLPPGAPAELPFRRCYESGENRLELLGCVVDRTEYTALRLTKNEHECNVVWRTDLIFEKPRDEGRAWIRVQLGRHPIDPEKPCILTGSPQVPGLIAVLKKEGLIEQGTFLLPRILIGADQPAALKKVLRHQVGPLAWVEESPDVLTGNAAVRVVWDACQVTKDYGSTDDPEALANLVAMEVFALIGQVRGDFSMDIEILQRLSPQPAAEMPDVNMNYCFMNKPMATKLRVTRRELGMSQSALAKAVNVTNLVISRMETLRVSRAPIALVRQIEQVLGLPADAILSLQREETEPAVEIAVPQEEPVPVPAAPAAPRKNRFCRMCGARLYEDSRFCSSCGTGVLPDIESY